MGRCAGTKGNGERCRGIAATTSDYCPAHDPNRQEARHRATSKAAKSKRGKGVLDRLYEQTRKLYEALERGEIEPKVGAVLVQAVNAQSRIVELHRRIEFSDVISREQLNEAVEVVTQSVKDKKTIEAISRGLEARIERSLLEEGD
jgi:DNA replicative helicase MCM subunit Mcm2 (Cdc46/Mcm family)